MLSASVSCRLCRLISQWKESLRNSACLRTAVAIADPPPQAGPAPFLSLSSLSADCTRWSSGERGGSALFGRGLGAGGGEGWSLEPTTTGDGAWAGGGAWGELTGEGVCANGDKGMLPADLQRADRYCRCSFGERPCRELGRICCDTRGPVGALWDREPENRGDRYTHTLTCL